jgi:hypothetical protein
MLPNQPVRAITDSPSGGWPTFCRGCPALAFFARVGTQYLRRGGEPDFDDELSKRGNLELWL